MREIFIKHNPYRLETTVLIDGEAPRQNSKLNFADHRLQEWVEDLPDILFEECSSRDFKLTFHGTILDYEDVEAMTHEAKKKGINIELIHIPAKEVSDKETAISEIFDEIQKGPFEELKQPDVVRAFNLAKSSDFEVDVVATMSAGKSTLINALLGKKLMPAMQRACTATITEIKDNDREQFMAKVYDAEGNLIQTHPELTFDIMKALNDNSEVSRIRVEGNIPFVTAEDVALVLVDTPGPNSSRNPEHKAATYRMLSESSKTLVLYILNGEQPETNDDHNLLNDVADSMRVGGKQSRDRFIFVVNKLDNVKKGEDSVDAAIKEARDYLRDNGIENANIYPASALTALNIRTILAESDDDNDDDDDVYAAKGKVRKFNRNEEMHFETMAPLTPSMRGQIEARLAKARANGNVNEEALIHCGIVPIEMAIQMYVRKYAKTAKIKNIVDTFSKRLESAKSFEMAKQKITENQDQQREILEKIDAINRKLDNGKEAKKFKSRIDAINYDKEIADTVNTIIVKAQERVTDQLEVDSNKKMTRNEAEQWCKEFASFVNNLQAEIRVKLEQLIETHIHKSATDLLEEYRKRLSELTQDIKIGEDCIDPFEFMAGDIDFENVKAFIDESEETEEKWEVVGSHKKYKELIGFRRFLNRHLGMDIDVDYEYVNDYDWVEHTYIDRQTLGDRFSTPIQEQLYKNGDKVVNYAKQQTQTIKKEYSKRFDELDNVLKRKLEELKECEKNKKDVERRIRESQDKLKWLENIQKRMNDILDI